MIRVDYSGNPVAKQRARPGKNGHYTPPETRRFEQALAHRARAVMAQDPPLAGALRFQLQIRLPTPQAWPLWKRQAAFLGEVVPTYRPDISNVLKACEDALNGIVYGDDCQLVEESQVKRYARPGHEGVTIMVSVLSAAPAGVSNQKELEAYRGGEDVVGNRAAGMG